MEVAVNRISRMLVVAAIALATVGVGTSLAATPPAGMSEQEFRAQQIRSQALNDLYGAPEVTSQYKAMVRADRIRGEAMNRLARNGVLSAPIFVATDTAVGSGFDWGDFSIGLGAMLGLVLVAGGLAVGVRTARRQSTQRPSPAS